MVYRRACWGCDKEIVSKESYWVLRMVKPDGKLVHQYPDGHKEKIGVPLGSYCQACKEKTVFPSRGMGK